MRRNATRSIYVEASGRHRARFYVGGRSKPLPYGRKSQSEEHRIRRRRVGRVVAVVTLAGGASPSPTAEKARAKSIELGGGEWGELWLLLRWREEQAPPLRPKKPEEEHRIRRRRVGRVVAVVTLAGGASPSPTAGKARVRSIELGGGEWGELWLLLHRREEQAPPLRPRRRTQSGARLGSTTRLAAAGIEPFANATCPAIAVLAAKINRLLALFHNSYIGVCGRPGLPSAPGGTRS